jgi:hypothetical protein
MITVCRARSDVDIEQAERQIQQVSRDALAPGLRDKESGNASRLAYVLDRATIAVLRKSE